MKRNKRKFTIVTYALILLMFSSAAYMGSSLYLKQYNNQLAVSIQNVERKIQQANVAKQSLSVEIDKMIDKASIFELAHQDGMEINNDSVVYIYEKDN